MAYPTVKVEISFVDSPYYPYYTTWTDVTSYVRSASVRRGRTDDFQNFDVGSATIVLDNRARRFDPYNTAGPYYGQLLPRRWIRITADPGTGIGYQNVYTGYVAGWPVSWTDAGYDSTVTVECFDLLGLLGDSELPPDWISGERNLGNYWAWWAADDQPGSTTITNRLARNAGVNLVGTTGITQLDPFGAGYRWTPKRPASTMTSTTVGLNVVGTLKETAIGAYIALVDPTPSSNTTIMSFGAFTIVNTSTGLTVEFIKSGTKYTYNLGTGVQTFQPFHIIIVSDVTVSGLRKIYVNGQSVTLSATTAATGTAPTNVATVTDRVAFQDFFVWAQEYGGWTDAQFDAWAAYNYGLAINYYEETTANRFDRYMATSDLATIQYQTATNPETNVAQLALGGPLLPAIQRTADSEGGEIYVDKAGVVTFVNRSYAAAKGAGSSAATFDDTGTNLKYGTNLEIEYNADTVRNSITLNYSGGNTYQTENLTSVTDIGRAEFSVDTDVSTYDQAASLAAFYVGTGAALKPQVSAIDVSPNTANSAWATILGLELLDKITVTRTPSTGSVFTQGLCINQIQHDITPNQWKTTILGSGRYVGWFVLDVSKLDGPDLLI